MTNRENPIHRIKSYLGSGSGSKSKWYGSETLPWTLEHRMKQIWISWKTIIIDWRINYISWLYFSWKSKKTNIFNYWSEWLNDWRLFLWMNDWVCFRLRTTPWTCTTWWTSPSLWRTTRRSCLPWVTSSQRPCRTSRQTSG